MEIAVPVALGAALALVVLVVAAAVLLVGRSRARSELRAARSDTALLAARLDELAARVEAGAPRGASVDGAEAAYVITDAGSGHDEPAGQVSDRLVLSATLGEPLVRAVALGHGVRRALSAESRNRIRFEVRRETRRSRKQRRRDMRDAWRRERSAAAAAGAPTGPASPVTTGAA